MSSRPDALVVGAGIVGAACADALAAAGLRVRVLESAFAAGGSTAVGMGHLVVMDDSPAQMALTTFGLKLWDQRASELPPACELQRCGTLWLASDETELAQARSKAVLYEHQHVAAELLDAASLRAAEPQLCEGLAGALLVTGDAVLYPPAAACFLLARPGVELCKGVAVHALAARRARTSGGMLEADLVVNAAGIDAPTLVPGLPIEPRKGQLVVTERYPGFVRHQLVELGYLRSAHGHSAESVAFNVQPRPGEQLLIGSSREFVGRDASINYALRSRMLARAFAFLPELRGLLALRTWTGFRPATPDKLPLLGEWEPGLFIAAGHEGLGVTTALASGRLLADLALGRRPAIDPLPYAPRRTMPAASEAGH